MPQIPKLSWIIRGVGKFNISRHLTGSALLHPIENPQVRNDIIRRTVTLNLFQGLKQVLLKMLNQVQHDKKNVALKGK